MQRAPISRARYVHEKRTMRFKEALDGWTPGRLMTLAAATLRLGHCARSFRRRIKRYEADGLEGVWWQSPQGALSKAGAGRPTRYALASEGGGGLADQDRQFG